MLRTPPKPDTDKARERQAEAERLAAALRENLKRRKAGARVARAEEERN